MRHRTELQQLTIDGAHEVVAVRDLSPTWGGSRPGAGRKKSRPDSVTISIRINAWEKKILQYRAKENGMTLSSYLVKLIRALEYPGV